MDYRKHYDLLIDRAKTRQLSGYVETHHVVPRCMGGNDVFANLVQLTPEEHFVAHQLLCKIYPKVRGLAYAVQAMTASNDRSHRQGNKLFGWLRRRYAAAQKGRVKSAQERANIAAAGRNRKPRTFSPEARANMSLARLQVWERRRQKGEHRLIAAKTRAKRIENGSYKFSEEHKAAIGRASKIAWEKRKSESKSDLMQPRPTHQLQRREVTL